MNEQVFVVEDEPKLAVLLDNYLTREQYRVRCFHDGQMAMDALKQGTPDIVLLDLMLPGLDGLSLCRELRKFSDVPVIMITARVEEIDRLMGLDIGADDYVCKPFSPREVVARVKTVLRRVKKDAPSGGRASFVLDEATAHVTVDNMKFELTAIELQLMKVLSESPGRIFNRAQLMSRIYTDGRIVSDRTIDSHIKKLRQKLSSGMDSTALIHSVYGLGYKFEMPADNTSVD